MKLQSFNHFIEHLELTFTCLILHTCVLRLRGPEISKSVQNCQWSIVNRSSHSQVTGCLAIHSTEFQSFKMVAMTFQAATLNQGTIFKGSGTVKWCLMGGYTWCLPDVIVDASFLRQCLFSRTGMSPEVLGLKTCFLLSRQIIFVLGASVSLYEKWV